MIREDIPVQKPEAPEVATPIEVTPSAAEKLRGVMADKGLEGAGLRVFVSGGGCSGLQYGMAFENEGGDEGDVVFQAQGLNVYVDPVSIQYLQGAHIDFVDSLMGGGFKIENPNAQASCGCGSSFKPKGEEGAEQAQAPQGHTHPGGGCSC